MRTVVVDRNHVAGWFVGLLDNKRVIRLWGPYGYQQAKRVAESVARAELSAAELETWKTYHAR